MISTAPVDAVSVADPVDAVTSTPVVPLMETDEDVDCSCTLPAVAVTDSGPDVVEMTPLPAPVDVMSTPVAPVRDTAPAAAFVDIAPDDDDTKTPVAPFNVT